MSETATAIADIGTCVTRRQEEKEEYERRISGLTAELAEAHQLIDQMMADQYARPGSMAMGRTLTPIRVYQKTPVVLSHTLHMNTGVEETRAWLRGIDPLYEMTVMGYPNPVIATVYADGQRVLSARPGQTLHYHPEHGLTVTGLEAHATTTETENTPWAPPPSSPPPSAATS